MAKTEFRLSAPRTPHSACLSADRYPPTHLQPYERFQSLPLSSERAEVSIKSWYLLNYFPGGMGPDSVRFAEVWAYPVYIRLCRSLIGISKLLWGGRFVIISPYGDSVYVYKTTTSPLVHFIEEANALFCKNSFTKTSTWKRLKRKGSTLVL